MTRKVSMIRMAISKIKMLCVIMINMSASRMKIRRMNMNNASKMGMANEKMHTLIMKINMRMHI
eukprot:4264077-Lingulodinium_polyedra.AAC.1